MRKYDTSIGGGAKAAVLRCVQSGQFLQVQSCRQVLWIERQRPLVGTSRADGRAADLEFVLP